VHGSADPSDHLRREPLQIDEYENRIVLNSPDWSEPQKSLHYWECLLEK
jgi:hypothetical protein